MQKKIYICTYLLKTKTMSKLYYGSLCLTDILEQAKQSHSAFRKVENGKIYFNVNFWINDELDKYGNAASVQIQPAKDSTDEKKYIGNLKESEKKEGSPVMSSDIPSDNDLPF
jgi:hypothetical protein